MHRFYTSQRNQAVVSSGRLRTQHLNKAKLNLRHSLGGAGWKRFQTNLTQQNEGCNPQEKVFLVEKNQGIT